MSAWVIFNWVAAVCSSLVVIALFVAISIALLKAAFAKKPADGQTTIMHGKQDLR